MDQGIEFVKLYRAHLGRIIDVALSADNLRFCTVAEDQVRGASLRQFDETPNCCYRPSKYLMLLPMT